MSGLKIDVEEGRDGIVCIELAGFLDAHNYDKLEETFKKHFDGDRYRYIVDLSRLEYISSAGAGVFIGAASTCQEHGGNVVLVRPTTEVEEIFDLLGVDQLFPVVKAREEAIAQF
jgi:anti-sigma B factor antagonist